MTVEALVETAPPLLSGETRFVRPSAMSDLARRCELDGYLVVQFPELRPAIRGRLAWLFEEAIERALELRGACPPGIGASADVEQSLRDQLYRARLLGTKGLMLWLRSLEGITNRIGALDADDSACLRFWIGCTKSYPVRLFLDVDDCLLGVYLEPLTLADAVNGGGGTTKPTSYPVVVEWVDAKSGPCVNSAREQLVPVAGPELEENDTTTATELDSVTSELDSVTSEPNADAGSAPSPLTDEPEPEAGTECALAVTQAANEPALMSRDADLGETDAPRAETEPNLDTSRPMNPGATKPSEPSPHATALVPCHRPLNPEAANAWKHWLQKLDAARGPKPLNTIEQLFINAYVPLSDALHRGIATRDCEPVLEQWAASFSRSYSEAFDAIRLRGRRPMMVLDIVEAAQRLARLHGARGVQLVLVDGMRFDVGARVEAHLVPALGQEATLTDRFLLWSALPTTTAQQLELIGRGPDGLRDGDLHTESHVLVARGKQASMLRRIRAGSRELLKLDLVEARLSESGPPVAERLDALAVEIADSLSSAFARMAPRTLVAVFGDHGFRLDPTEQGSSALRQGGSSPEEVLVPGYAWLVGQPH